MNVAGQCTGLKPVGAGPDRVGMSGADELLLVVVGLGVAAFGLAAMSIACAAAQDAIERHMVMVRAVHLRNEHLRALLSIRGVEAPEMPVAIPIDGEASGVDTPRPAGRAAA